MDASDHACRDLRIGPGLRLGHHRPGRERRASEERGAPLHTHEHALVAAARGALLGISLLGLRVPASSPGLSPSSGPSSGRSAWCAPRGSATTPPGRT